MIRQIGMLHLEKAILLVQEQRKLDIKMGTFIERWMSKGSLQIHFRRHLSFVELNS